MRLGPDMGADRPGDSARAAHIFRGPIEILSIEIARPRPTSEPGKRPQKRLNMAAQLNHTIVWCQDPKASAQFLADMLGRPPPGHVGPFDVVELDNGVSLDFGHSERGIAPQHYAFLIDEADFDAVLGRIHERKLDHWADPMRNRPGEINHRDGGRGVYFPDPDGHFLEVLTRPYGSGN
jgi:catechol 2,3-dioxygenase-like lactoylglutathione lyase family enzyme